MDRRSFLAAAAGAVAAGPVAAAMPKEDDSWVHYGLGCLVPDDPRKPVTVYHFDARHRLPIEDLVIENMEQWRRLVKKGDASP